MSHGQCTGRTTALRLMASAKVSTSIHAWMAKPSNSAFMVINIRPEDATDDLLGYLPGMLIGIEYKLPVRIPEEKYLFTLFKQEPGRLLRAYQIEVVPPHRRSSNHNGVVIHGPHEHIGPDAEELGEQYPANDFHGWLGAFCAKVNLVLAHPIPNPFDFTLAP